MSDALVFASMMIAALVILLPLLFHLTKYLGAQSDNVRKNETVEGGIRQVFKDSFESFNIKFFLIGIIFLIFDVEILFMFPWALNLRELGMFALLEMFVFVALLLAGLVYVYKSGILKWS
jgi:NADH-quinone oxidoreductase subunit A